MPQQPNMQQMMKQVQQMQADMEKAQAELKHESVEASAGGGKITVGANGAGEILSIKIDPSVVDPQDVEMLEDLVLVGVKQAIEDGRKMAAEEMKKVTGGMNIPGMPF